jgi:hypothetical protein
MRGEPEENEVPLRWRVGSVLILLLGIFLLVFFFLMDVHPHLEVVQGTIHGPNGLLLSNADALQQEEANASAMRQAGLLSGVAMSVVGVLLLLALRRKADDFK